MATVKNSGKADRSIEWFGSMSKVPLAEVLKKIALEEKSGDLQLIFGRTIKTIYFDRGFVVFSASNLKSDRLGEAMIKSGHISRQDFLLATMLMKGSRRKFGQALVQAGVISEEELGRQVALQVNRIILSLFGVPEGIYSFDERPTIIPVDVMVSLSIYRILLEGIRRMSNGSLILAWLPPLSAEVCVSDRPPFTVDFARLKPVEQDVLRAAGKGASISSIVKKVEHERGPVLRACYGLLMAGLLEEGSVRAAAKPLKVQEETGVFLLSDIQRKFARIKAQNIRQEILMEFDRLDRLGESELLKVDGKAGPEDLREAFDRQKREWEQKKNLVENEKSLVIKVDEIQARLEKAYRELVAQRENPPPVESTDEPMAFELEDPTASALPPLDEDLAEEVVIETGHGARTPEEPTADTRPKARATEEDEPIESADTRPHDAFVEDEPPELDAQQQQRADQLLRDVKLHFQVHDFEGAVSLLHELVRLRPQDPSYHGMLARAMARHPVMRKDAERHFIEALRLAPQDADLHYSLGLYYKSFGLHARAETELRAALRINPRHEGAQKHLMGDRRRKDPLGSVFRKIFG